MHQNPNSIQIKATFLGTGTSQGIPVIGCDCAVCQSDDPRDQRLRTSLMFSEGDQHVVIDVGPDFRQQMLRTGVQQIEAILLTHEHNDHIIGMDDVRPFNFRASKDMPVYGLPRVLDEVRARFGYIFKANPYPGAPRVSLNPIGANAAVKVGGMNFQPIEVLHGNLPVLGFRLGEFTYITDAKTIAPAEIEKIKGSKYLVLNALHHRKHHSHLNLEEALNLIDILQPEKAFLIHLSHQMGLMKEIETQLPTNVTIAYDGLEVFFNDH